MTKCLHGCLTGNSPGMEGTAHALSHHIEETCGLAGDYDVIFAENIAINQRKAKIFLTCLQISYWLQLHSMFDLQVVHYPLLGQTETVPFQDADSNDLAAVPGMAPGVIAKFGVKPEMEVIIVQRAFNDPMEFLAYDKPGDLFGIIWIKII